MQVMPLPPKVIPKRQRLRGSAIDDHWRERCADAKEMCEAGFTDREMADVFGVDVKTIYVWRAANPAFREACKLGKQLPDDRVVGVLYTLAQGFEYVEQEAIKIKTGEHTEEVQIVEVRKYQPPDKAAVIFWLKNRRREEWRDQHEMKVAGELTTTEKDPRALAIAMLATLRLAMEQAKAGGTPLTIEGDTDASD